MGKKLIKRYNNNFFFLARSLSLNLNLFASVSWRPLFSSFLSLSFLAFFLFICLKLFQSDREATLALGASCPPESPARLFRDSSSSLTRESGGGGCSAGAALQWPPHQFPSTVDPEHQRFHGAFPESWHTPFLCN